MSEQDTGAQRPWDPDEDGNPFLAWRCGDREADRYAWTFSQVGELLHELAGLADCDDEFVLRRFDDVTEDVCRLLGEIHYPATEDELRVSIQVGAEEVGGVYLAMENAEAAQRGARAIAELVKQYVDQTRDDRVSTAVVALDAKLAAERPE